MRYLSILLVCISTTAQAEPFISFDNPSLTREERMIKIQVEKHRVLHQYADNHEFIQKDLDSVLEREGFINVPKKPSGEEHYNGR